MFGLNGSLGGKLAKYGSLPINWAGLIGLLALDGSLGGINVGLSGLFGLRGSDGGRLDK